MSHKLTSDCIWSDRIYVYTVKPDNGLGGTSLHGLVFLLGQFNLGENRLSKLVGWFGSSYCLE